MRRRVRKLRLPADLGGPLFLLDVLPLLDPLWTLMGPVPLMDGWGSWDPVRGYDVLADGSFIVMALLDRDRDGAMRARGATEMHVIWNFFEELEARVGN